MSRSSLSEQIYRILPGEQNKRIREAILAAAGYAGQRSNQVRKTIEEPNRLRTGLLIPGTTEILTDTSAEQSGYVWVVYFAVQQPVGVQPFTIDAPDALYGRDDYFIGLADGTTVYRPGTVDALGNSFPPEYDRETEVVLRIVRRNPDGTNTDVEIPGSSNLIDFAEQNIIPYVASGKLKYSGIQVIFDTLGVISGFKFPTPVKGLPAVNDDEFVTKAQLDNASDSDAVHYNVSDGKSDPEKAQARENIDVYSTGEVDAVTGDLDDLTVVDKTNLVVAINQKGQYRAIEW